MSFARLSALLTASLTLCTLAASGCGKSDDDSTSGDTGTSSGSGGPATTTGADSSGSGSGSGESTAPTTTGPEPTGSATDPGTEVGENTTGVAEGCDAYCDLIATNCAGPFTQYGTLDSCLKSCAAFEPGTPGEMSGNTLGCRTYHAGAAAMADDVHCGHAGPGGDGACGSNCEGFCAIAGEYCPDAWPDNAACITACTGFPADEPYDATDVAGNTLACRLYHVTAAAVDPVTHCGHIKGDSPTCI